MSKTIGDVIREYREKHSISMDVFSERSGLSKAYISMLEKNKNPRTGHPIEPSLETYISVANATGKTVEDLLIEAGSEAMVRLGKKAARDPVDLDTIVNRHPKINQIQSVSMVGTAACETVQVSIITDVNHNGIPDQLEEGANYPTLTIPEVFLSEQCDAKHVFIFRISVPSSERLLPPGRSYVIVRTNITLDCFENGDFALFEKCENQYVVKRVYFSGDNIVIRPFIDHLDYVEYIDHVICVDEFYRRIKGKVIGHFVIDE